MNNIAVKLAHVDKSFNLPRERQNTLKGVLVNIGKRGYDKQDVLKDFSLDIYKGEFIGILGRNGSGKSTLLKTLSGIYTADRGQIDIDGKLTPFIELGVGFNPELSGRDNVYLNGALLGFSRPEIDAIYDEIVEFAELHRFMDQKLKNYSSGMQVRLAFSIAIRADTDILVLDEVLAVGDEAFQRKCYDYFNELKLKHKTVVLVTHDTSAVQRFCTRAIVIDKGNIVFDGATDKASDVYRNLNLKSSEKALEKSNARRLRVESKRSYTQDVHTKNKNNVRTTLFKPGEEIVISTKVEFDPSFKEPVLQVWFNNPGGTAITSTKIKSDAFKKYSIDTAKPLTADWILEGIYNDGKYLVTVEVSDESTDTIYEVIKEAFEFEVIGWESPYVLVHPEQNINLIQQ